MEIINILARILAEHLTISQPAARGLLKLSLKDRFGPFKSFSQLEFDDFKDALNTALKERLIKLNVDDLDLIMGELNEQLIENQSLISMTKI